MFQNLGGKGVFLLTLVCFCQSSKRNDKAVLEGSGKYVWYLLEGQSICVVGRDGDGMPKSDDTDTCPFLKPYWVYCTWLRLTYSQYTKKRNTPSILAPHLLLKKTVPLAARAVGMLLSGWRASHPSADEFILLRVVSVRNPLDGVGWYLMVVYLNDGVDEWYLDSGYICFHPQSTG